MAAIAEQIIPADEDPGAIDAGVPNFIDKQLTGPYKRFQERYRSGIAGVDAAAREMRGRPFAPLIPMGAITGKPDEQTVQETLEAYKAAGIDQYLICARSGLEYECLGEDWLQMCQWFCQHARRLDM